MSDNNDAINVFCNPAQMGFNSQADFFHFLAFSIEVQQATLLLPVQNFFK